MSQAPFHSRFGGLWIDRHDFLSELSVRVAKRSITSRDAKRLTDFVRDGYLIIRRAASRNAVDAFQREIAQAFQRGRPDLLYQRHGEQETRPLVSAVDRLGSRVVDSYAVMPQALSLFTSPELVRFLRLIFEADPLLFQSISFDQGSQQGLHQDTAYVVVDQPLALAACWIALENIKPGSGELVYLPGSHRYPDYDFGRGKKNWSGDSDDHAVHVAWSYWIKAEAERRGLQAASFLARKGDILIWHADLAHGGAVVTDKALTRQSLVGHFCPSHCRPLYFDAANRGTTRAYGSLSYASGHYDLSEMPEVRPPAGLWRSLLGQGRLAQMLGHR